MCKKYFKRFLSLIVSLILVLSSFAYADTVVIGVAPGAADGRTISANTNTPYLQNQYTGPGTLPNSAMTGLSPIQGVSYASTNGQNYIDMNGLGYTGPTTQTTGSPSTNAMVTSANAGRVNAGVVANNALQGNRVTESSTANKGPTTAEAITSPSANGSRGVTSSDTFGPGYQNSNNQAATTTTNNNNAPPANTAATNAVLSDTIVYRPNDYIQAIKPSISAPAAIVLNATTRQIYYAKGGLDKYEPASLANLVTAAILIANRKLDDVLKVSQAAVSNLEYGATTAGLKAGDTITVRDALGALFVGSCCDVANVVAENLAGSTGNFVNVMNQTAKSWGCVSTNFTNPTGLNNRSQLTTTYDMAVIMDKVTASPELKIMLTQEKYVLPATAHRKALTLSTKNRILVKGDTNYYDGISASRMGYTSRALYTIASELDYNGQRFLAIVFKANMSQWTDTKKLLNFAKVASLEASANNVQTYITTFKSASSGTNSGATTTATSNTPHVVEAAATNAAQLPTGSTTSTPTTQNGDNAGAWAKEASGWIFVKSNGAKANNEWIRQNGKLYCIDSNGYMITGWKQMSNGNTYYFDETSGELKYNTWVNVATGSYYLQSDGSLAKASSGQTKNITTAVGTYTIDDTGKAIAKVS